MPILILILLIVLVAQFGFWDTLSAVLGGIGILVLLILTVAALVAAGFALAYRRFPRSCGRPACPQRQAGPSHCGDPGRAPAPGGQACRPRSKTPHPAGRRRPG